MSEAGRAAEYRRQMQAREQAALARARALAGSKASHDSLLAKTAPLHRDEGWDPVEYVTEAERTANG